MTDVRCCRIPTYHCINSAIFLLPQKPTVAPYVYILKTQALYSNKKWNEFVYWSEKNFSMNLYALYLLTDCLLSKLSSLLQGKFMPVLKKKKR